MNPQSPRAAKVTTMDSTKNKTTELGCCVCNGTGEGKYVCHEAEVRAKFAIAWGMPTFPPEWERINVKSKDEFNKFMEGKEIIMPNDEPSTSEAAPEAKKHRKKVKPSEAKKRHHKKKSDSSERMC